MNTQETTTCTKKRILEDVIVEADLSGMMFPRRHYKTDEERVKNLESAVREFHEFLRDHRSQDMVQLFVNRKYKDVCSACGCTWETYIIDGALSCANCDAIIQTTEACDSLEARKRQIPAGR